MRLVVAPVPALSTIWGTHQILFVSETPQRTALRGMVQDRGVWDLDDALPARADGNAAEVLQLPERLSNALDELGGGVPDLAQSIVAAGVAQLFQQRRVLHPFATDVVSASLLRLFVPPSRAQLALDVLILQSGMKTKGAHMSLCTRVMRGSKASCCSLSAQASGTLRNAELPKIMLWLSEAAEAMTDLLQPFVAALLDWLRPERGAPVECRCAVLQGVLRCCRPRPMRATPLLSSAPAAVQDTCAQPLVCAPMRLVHVC